MIARLTEYSFAVSFYSLSEINAYSRYTGVGVQADRLIVLIQNGMHVKKRKVYWHVCCGYPTKFLQIFMFARSYPLKFVEELAWCAAERGYAKQLSVILRAIQQDSKDLDRLNRFATKDWRNFSPDAVRPLIGDARLGYSLIIAVKSGVDDIVECIVKEGRCDPNVRGTLALQLAVFEEDRSMVNTLLKLGAKVTDAALSAAEDYDDRVIYRRLLDKRRKERQKHKEKLNNKFIITQ